LEFWVNISVFWIFPWNSEFTSQHSEFFLRILSLHLGILNFFLGLLSLHLTILNFVLEFWVYISPFWKLSWNSEFTSLHLEFFMEFLSLHLDILNFFSEFWFYISPFWFFVGILSLHLTSLYFFSEFWVYISPFLHFFVSAIRVFFFFFHRNARR